MRGIACKINRVFGHRLNKEDVMGRMQKKTFNSPDEVRNFDKGQLEIVNLGSITFGRATLQPGWRWSVIGETPCGYEVMRSTPLTIPCVRTVARCNG